MQATLKQRLRNAASLPYQVAGNFQYRMARGKLGADPMFEGLLEQGTLQQSHRVLDLGCGTGLLAAWFLAAEKLSHKGQWQPDFAVPMGLTFHGLDLNAKACAVGMRALEPLYPARVLLTSGDICLASLQGHDTIALMDVLHYIAFDQQDALLDRITEALAPDGLLLLRVGNAEGGWRFLFSQGVDFLVARAHGARLRRLYCRTHQDWVLALQSRGFTVTAQAMSAGTPFANVLFYARAGGQQTVK